MVNWLNIEDVSTPPARVWLSRQKESEEWKPLRKADCCALNDNSDDETPVLIEGGRAMAYPNYEYIDFNFTNQPPKALTNATWFYKDLDDDKLPILTPLPKKDAAAVEDLYQRTVHAASSLGSGMDDLLLEELLIDNDKYKIMLQKTGEGLAIRKVPTGWFGKWWDLQRGYGSYEVEGEEEEESLGPVNNLVFVIHGIGEAMWSREDFTMSTSLTDDCVLMRSAMQKRQVTEWKRKCEEAKRKKLPEPPAPNRVEFVPIFWYDRLHSSSNALMSTLRATTLGTIPALREIANDVIFDVLMYLTPNFCYEVLECVTEQINLIHDKFRSIHKEYKGNFSLMGHSLGTVICWDLLTILKEQQGHLEHGVHITPTDGHMDVGYQQYANETNANKAQNGSWGPSLPKPLETCLPFTPDFTLFFGSPVGLFLTLRGAHPVFDELRDQSPDSPRVSPFTLPSQSIHNIFHPSDPVAYRIEPLLLAQGTENFPPPLYLTREGESVRLHVKAKHLGDEIRKSIQQNKKTLTSFVNSITEQAQKALQSIDDSRNEAAPSAGNGDDDDDRPLRFPLAGKKSSNGRIDLQLQPRVIDNEYLAAVTAHINYWTNTDIIDYMIDLTRIKEDEEALEDAWTDVDLPEDAGSDDKKE